MTLATSRYKLGWERIFGKKGPRGCYYPVPSEAGIVVLQYAPDFKISCLLPPKKRDFTIEYRKYRSDPETAKFFDRSINTPTLMLSQLIRRTEKYDYDLPYYLGDPDPRSVDGAKKLACIQHHPACYCEHCKKDVFRKHRIKNQYYLFAVDDTKVDSIWAQPYRLNNVYEDGRCCFRKKDSRTPHPENLKQAHAQFWMDRFDNDFEVGVIPHKCESRYHNYRGCRKNRWDHLCYDNGGHHNSHTCDDSEEDCLCCDNDCDCYEDCDCCMDRCNCREVAIEVDCGCDCCRGYCGCGCSCYLGDAFADKLSNYKPDKEWLNYTKFIFGTNYISTSKKVHGVFFSADPDLLDDIPKKFHKKHPKIKLPFVIGFSKQCARGISIDLHAEMVFSLNNNQYMAVE